MVHGYAADTFSDKVLRIIMSYMDFAVLWREGPRHLTGSAHFLGMPRAEICPFRSVSWKI
jgi:hypothetical protein